MADSALEPAVWQSGKRPGSIPLEIASLHPRGKSDHVDCVRRHPDVDLFEAGLEALFELTEELPVFRLVSDIDGHAQGIIPINLFSMLPKAADDLGLPSNCSKLAPQLKQCLADQFLRHGLPIIEPQRQENLVATRGAHKCQARQR